MSHWSQQQQQHTYIPHKSHTQHQEFKKKSEDDEDTLSLDS
jgi:hypothetical protein